MLKRLLATLFLCATISSLLSGQYLRVAQEGRQWYSSYQGFFLGTEILAVGPDTTVGGQAFPTLQEQDQQGNFLKTLGWLEEDTLAGTLTVRTTDPAWGDFRYDFSLTSGDTISYPTVVGGRVTLRVDSVYQWTDAYNVVRKVLVMAVPAQNACGAETTLFIEGLGPNMSLLHPFHDCSVTDIPRYTLRCVFDGGTRIYGDTTQQCYIISREEHDLSTAQVYPNPVQDYLYLTSEQNLVSYQVFNAKGQRMAGGPLREQRLDLQALPAGLYLLEVSGRDGRVTQWRFLKK